MNELQKPKYTRVGYGNNHILNFGKYKGKNVYDIANEDKDIRYLTWLSKSEEMNPITMSHVKAIVNNWQTNPPCQDWEKVTRDEGTKEKISVYQRKDLTNSKVLAEGPEILEKCCSGCGNYKFKDDYTDDSSLCTSCTRILRSGSRNPYSKFQFT